MGWPYSPLLANIYIEYVKTLDIEIYFLKPKFWGGNIGDILIIRNSGESEIQGLNNIWNI